MAEQSEHGPLAIGLGKTAPPHWEIDRPPSWWAMAFTLAANGSLFASLLFGAIFLRTVGPGSQPAQTLVADSMSLVAAGALILAGAGGWGASRLAGAGAALALLTALLAHAGVALAVTLLVGQIPGWTAHAFNAVSLALCGYVIIHSLLGAVFAGVGLWRLAGAVAPSVRRLDLRIGALLHVYAATTGLLALGLVTLLPLGLSR